MALVCEGNTFIAGADIMLQQQDLCSAVVTVTAPEDYLQPVADDSPVSASVMASQHNASIDDDEQSTSQASFKHSVHQQEHRIILATMQECANRRSEVARKLGISDRTLRYKLARMRESGISIPA